MTSINKGTIAVIVLLLTIVLTAPAFATGSKPVLSVTDYKVVPYMTLSAQSTSGPLMPGDSGLVVVTIMNTLKASTATNTTTHVDSVTSNYFDSTHQTPGTVQTMSDQKTSSEGSVGTATIKFVNLIADGPIQVTSGQYTEVGVLGTGDSARFEFGIKADNGAVDGTYLLTLKVKTTDDEVFVNYPVRVQVDSTEPRLIVSRYADAFNTTDNEMSLDVANPRKTAIEAVSISAAGDEFVFEPQEYFIGTLSPGDTYTADFAVYSLEKAYNTSPAFTIVYRNGDNWHSTAPVTVASLTHPVEKGYWEKVWDDWWPYIIVGVLGIITLAIFVRILPELKRKKGQ